MRSQFGDWAVVTGASSGIGREMARQLAAKGVDVVLVARRLTELEELRREIVSAGQAQAMTCAVDLAKPGAAAEVLAAVGDRKTGLLVNAAGFGLGGNFLEQPLGETAAMIDVNCRAVAELTYLFAQRFAAQRRGGIILFSSIVAFQGVPRIANYAATKAYIQSFGEALADELGAHGVHVLVAKPGPTNSGFAARAGMNLGKAEKAEDVARETLQALGRRTSVTPGWQSKFLLGSLMTAPRSLRVRIMKGIMRSMT